MPVRTTSISLADPEVGASIRDWREGAGLSQRELARRLSTAQSAVSRWEHGHDMPRLTTLVAIARECGLRLSLTAEADVDSAAIRAMLAQTPRQRLQSSVNVSRMLARARRAT